MSRVAVVGAGAWGTTLSILLAEKEHKVTLWVYENDLAAEMKELRENKRFLPASRCRKRSRLRMIGHERPRRS